MTKEPFGCVNNTIRLRSGLYFDLADPRPEQFTFADIAGALAKICRFGGQVERFYSVAEHCFHCADQARKDLLSNHLQRACLLHDAAEAFAGDVVKPLKIMLPDYARIETRIESVISDKYGGLDFTSDKVREIDLAMLIAERRALFSADDVTWTGENQVRRLDVWFSCWGPVSAEMMFMDTAAKLGLEVDR